MPSSYGPLVTAVKLKSKETIRTVDMLFYIL